jgi:hypothetical protein
MDEAGLVTRTLARLEEDERPALVPERERAVRTGAVKTSGRLASPSPNAPQLFRLVRHPFALDVTRPVRGPSGKQARVVREQQTLEQLSQRVRRTCVPPREAAVVVDGRRPARAPRPSAAAWLEGDRT